MISMRLPLRAAKSRLALPTQDVVTRTPLAAFLSSITPASACTASSPTILLYRLAWMMHSPPTIGSSLTATPSTPSSSSGKTPCPGWCQAASGCFQVTSTVAGPAHPLPERFDSGQRCPADQGHQQWPSWTRTILASPAERSGPPCSLTPRSLMFSTHDLTAIIMAASSSAVASADSSTQNIGESSGANRAGGVQVKALWNAVHPQCDGISGQYGAQVPVSGLAVSTSPAGAAQSWHPSCVRFNGRPTPPRSHRRSPNRPRSLREQGACGCTDGGRLRLRQ
jgi:hypothetical protein